MTDLDNLLDFLPDPRRALGYVLLAVMAFWWITVIHKCYRRYISLYTCILDSLMIYWFVGVALKLSLLVTEDVIRWHLGDSGFPLVLAWAVTPLFGRRPGEDATKLLTDLPSLPYIGFGLSLLVEIGGGLLHYFGGPAFDSLPLIGGFNWFDVFMYADGLLLIVLVMGLYRHRLQAIETEDVEDK